jgi:phage gp29-like protein
MISQQSAPKVSAERVRLYLRSRFNPIRSLTPELLAQYLDSFKTGYLRQCALIWDAIEERDDTLAGVISKRKAAAARHGWEILTLDSVPKEQQAEADRHKEVLENFYNNLTAVNAIDENERGEVSLLIRQMMDAIAKKYAIHEIVWQPSGPAGLTAELRFVPLWFFEHTTGRLRFLQSEGIIEGVPMDDTSWMVSVGPGLMPACSVAYMYKTMSLRDWVIYNARHGMPGIHGKTDAAKGSDEWDTMVEAVQNFAAELSMVTNSSGSIEKIDLSTTGQIPYPPLVERMDRAMAAIWRGADLSTLSGKTSDAGQGASLQGDETAILEQDDCQWLSETLSRNLDRRVIEYHFGPGVLPLAYIKIKTSQRKNIQQEIAVDSFLHQAGVPISIDSLLERYNRPQPDPNDLLLGRAVPGEPFPSVLGAGTPPSRSLSADAGTAQPGRNPPPPARLREAPATGSPASASFTNSATPSLPDQAAIGMALAGLRDQLLVAQDKSLAPLRAEIARILAAPAGDLKSEISNLKFRLPEILRAINATPDTQKYFEGILGVSLLEGMQK